MDESFYKDTKKIELLEAALFLVESGKWRVESGEWKTSVFRFPFSVFRLLFASFCGGVGGAEADEQECATTERCGLVGVLFVVREGDSGSRA